MQYHVDEKGFYGDFGGAFIPELLYPNVEELAWKFKESIEIHFLSYFRFSSNRSWRSP